MKTTVKIIRKRIKVKGKMTFAQFSVGLLSKTAGS
jgi:hypothetical protein